MCGILLSPSVIGFLFGLYHLKKPLRPHLWFCFLCLVNTVEGGYLAGPYLHVPIGSGTRAHTTSSCDKGLELDSSTEGNEEEEGGSFPFRG